MTHTKISDLSWAAGLFEGEGSIHICSSRKRYKQLRAKVNMIDRDVIYRFAKILGFGRIHVVKPRQSHHKKQWSWMTTHYEEVQWLVILFWKYFGRRRRAQAKRTLRDMRRYQLRNLCDT